MRAIVLASLLVMRVAWRCGPLAVVLTAGEVLATVLRFVQPLIFGLIVSGLVTRSSTAVVVGSVLLALALGIGGILEAVAVGHRVKLIEDVGHAFDAEVMRALARIRVLDQLEEPRLASALSKVRDRADSMGYCFNGLASVVIQAAAPLTSIVVALIIDPRLLLLPLAGIPTILVARKLTRLQDSADDRAQEPGARALAWAELARDSNAASERKVFQLWNWYRSSIGSAIWRRERALNAPLRFESLATLGADLVYLLCTAAVLVWIVPSNGTPGAVAAALLVALDLQGTLGALRLALSNLGPSLRAAVGLREVQAAAADAVAAAEERVSSGEGIDLRNVHYQYPGGSSPALEGVDLTVEPGQVLAVVGVNGAGKSTLAEVLLGLRQATGTRVGVPAIDNQSVVAQDFARLELSVGESVSLDDHREESVPPVRDALLAAGAPDEWSARSPFSVQVGSEWGGVEPSGGQWQALAAARCFLRRDAQLVVLDEPLAALDPEAQEEVTSRYLEWARRIAQRGGIAVLITHRMSMPRRADQIVVVDAGRIVERGSHEELLALGERYAAAYRSQTAGFA